MANHVTCPSIVDVRLKMKIVLVRDGHIAQLGVDVNALNQRVLELYPSAVRQDINCLRTVEHHIRATMQTSAFRGDGGNNIWYDAGADDHPCSSQLANFGEIPNKLDVRVKMKIVLKRDGSTQEPEMRQTKLVHQVLELCSAVVKTTQECRNAVIRFISVNRREGRGFSKKPNTMAVTRYSAREDPDPDC
jgi:hypothetical protein